MRYGNNLRDARGFARARELRESEPPIASRDIERERAKLFDQILRVAGTRAYVALRYACGTEV